MLWQQASSRKARPATRAILFRASRAAAVFPVFLAAMAGPALPPLDAAAARENASQEQLTKRAPLLIETDRGVVTLDVEIADTPALRSRGLMFRQRLPQGRGMLLLWPRPAMAALWMKNTLVPLDMVFIDGRGRIVHIHENARPGDLTPVTPGRPVIAVLEIPAGEARRLGLRPGLRVSLPRP